MATTVRVLSGSYKDFPVNGQVFTLARKIESETRIQVRNNGQLPTKAKQVYIDVPSGASFEVLGTGRSTRAPADVVHFGIQAAAVEDHHISETDEEAMDRIATRFSVLDEMTAATINGDIRAMIVTGPPGVGKSHGVETQLEKASLFDRLASKKIRYEVVKGAMTALGLYAQLYKFSDRKNVLVFDDCDSVLMDDLALNILKAALDSGKRRKIFWNSDSSLLRREGIPDSFEFNGSAIFITNLNFSSLKSKKLQDHLEALQSRCHFLDLTIDTVRDKMLRIKQVHRDAEGGLFKDYDFEDETMGETILDFMWDNKDRLREISLRMSLKIADLVKISPNNWRALTESTCMARK